MGLGTCSVRYEGDEGWIETGDRGEFRVFPSHCAVSARESRAGTHPAPTCASSSTA